jgi:hypothetical protein
MHRPRGNQQKSSEHDHDETEDPVLDEQADHIARNHERDQARHDDREQRAERCGVQGFQQRGVHDRRIPAPVDRPHPHEQVGGLLRRVVEEFRDDLDGAQRPYDRDHGHEIEAGAQDALRQREALPPARLHGFGAAHWNILRIQPDTISPTITTAMMASTMVSTKS